MVDRNIQYPDGGYGWVVTLSAALITGFGTTAYKLVGQIYMNMLQNTNYTRSQVAVVYFSLKLNLFAAIFSTKLAELYSFRVTLFCGSFLFGLGLCLSSIATNNLGIFTLTLVIAGMGAGGCVTPSNAVVGLYFKKKRPIAMGLMTSLSGIISLVMPITLQWFLDEFSLNGALLLWGGLVIHGCVAAMFIRQPTWALQRGKLNNDTNDAKRTFLKTSFISKNIYNFFKLVLTQFVNDCRHFRQFTFIVLLVSRCSFMIATTSVPFILPQYAAEQIDGITSTEIAFLLSVFYFGDVISRLLGGSLNIYIPSKYRRTAFLISFLCIATILLSFKLVHSYVTALVVCLIYGIFNGHAFVTYYLIIFDTFGPADSPGVIALHVAVFGIFLLLTAPLTVNIILYLFLLAWIRDVTG
uniref:Major facilitator superfamily (MFS) profile domain-containing protein n=1 Tax=Strigamia maritima TaxID=126957 RepID=T1J2R4_STRMM